jgi:hypothetical protein
VELATAWAWRRWRLTRRVTSLPRLLSTWVQWSGFSIGEKDRERKKEMREMERKLKWNFCFFWVEAEEEDREIGEEEDERDVGERKKKSEKNVWWGREREKRKK